MILEILSGLIIAAGVLLFVSGTLGLIRFPDFYCRMHATGKCDTLGALLALIGLALYNGFNLVTLKIIFIAVFIFVANPTATHAIGRAALLSGVQPWMKSSKRDRSPDVPEGEEI